MLELHAFSKVRYMLRMAICIAALPFGTRMSLMRSFTKRQFVFGSKHVYNRIHIDESSTMINIGAYVLAFFGWRHLEKIDEANMKKINTSDTQFISAEHNCYKTPIMNAGTLVRPYSLPYGKMSSSRIQSARQEKIVTFCRF